MEDSLDDAWLQFAEENSCDKPENQQPSDALVGSASGDGGSQQASSSGKKGHEKPKKKPLQISMEAMVRGFKKYTEGEEESVPNEECHHNVAAWHNVPHP